MPVRPKTQCARRLRRDSTEAERILWRALRELRLPVNVRRQHPIGPYVADFAVPACGLVIELDGGQHAAAVEADAERTRALEARGWRVVHFWNNEATSNLEGVLTVIVGELGEVGEIRILGMRAIFVIR